MSWRGAGWNKEGWSRLPVIGGGGFTTLDPAAHDANAILSGGNLVMSLNTGQGGARSIASHSSGKFYCEAFGQTSTGSIQWSHSFGICNASWDLHTFPAGDVNSLNFPNGGANDVYLNNVSIGTDGTYSVLPGPPDEVDTAVDFDNHRIWFRVNGGNWNGSSGNNPATNTGGIDISSMTGPFFMYGFLQAGGGNTFTWTFNFGATSFAGTPPSGFGNW